MPAVLLVDVCVGKVVEGKSVQKEQNLHQNNLREQTNICLKKNIVTSLISICPVEPSVLCHLGCDD